MPTDENAPPAVEPPGPAVAIDEAQVKRVRDDLDRLAKEYKNAAQEHLRRGGKGLFFGFALAVFLPGLFTLIDVTFERLRDWIAPAVATTVADKEISEFNAEFSALKAERARLLAQAGETRFASLQMLLDANPPASTSELTFFSPLSCQAPGESYRNFAGGAGGDFALLGIDTTDPGTSQTPTLVLDSPDGGPCPTVKLGVPIVPGLRPEINVHDATLQNDYLLIFGDSAPRSVSQNVERPKFRAIACSLEASGPGGAAPCKELSLPAPIGRDGDNWVQLMAFDIGLGVVLGGTSGTTFIEVNESAGAGGDIIAGLSLRRLDVDFGGRGPGNIIKKSDGLYLYQFEQRGNEQRLHVARIAANSLAPETRHIVDWKEAPSVSGFGNISTLDFAQLSDGRFLVLQTLQGSNPLVLALTGGIKTLSLRAEGTNIDDNFSNVIFTATREDGTESAHIVLDHGGFSPSGQQVFSAKLETVIKLFTPGAATVPPGSTADPKALETTLFADIPPWGQETALIPARDAALYEQARAIIENIESDSRKVAIVNQLRDEYSKALGALEAATKKSDEQDAEISLWSTIAARVIVISLILYFVQLEVSLYRYDSRLSGHYRARVLAIDYLLAVKAPMTDSGFENLFSALVAIDAREVSAKDPPRPPSDKLFEVLRDLVKARVSPG